MLNLREHSKRKVQSEGQKREELIPDAAPENEHARRQHNPWPALCVNFEMATESLSRASPIRTVGKKEGCGGGAECLRELREVGNANETGNRQMRLETTPRAANRDAKLNGWLFLSKEFSL